VKRTVLVVALVVCYVSLMGPFTRYLTTRPVAVRIGYVPRPQALKAMAADHRGDLAAFLVLKTLMYFGSLGDHPANQVDAPPDYLGMYDLLSAAVKLDPYNMDSYYFAQAFLVWDLNRIKEANALLDYGMKYRSWDWYLPFFAGFNSAYFLKDYAKAAAYFKRVGELTGSELSVNLTGRYLYQSGQTELAIGYLSAMEKGATNAAIKKTYGMRLDAFTKVRLIEVACDRFQAATGRRPATVAELVAAGYLKGAPLDPYGGEFYLDDQGKVRSTSDFATGWREHKQKTTAREPQR
jgi:tetratricopeptide (TPR) repeat protein